MSDDARAIAELAKVSDPDSPHSIVHYLYLPNGEVAHSIADSLRRQRFLTEARISADGMNWLVLARHEAVPTEELLVSTRRFLKSLMDEVGGEYDDWETTVQRPMGKPPAIH